MRKRVMVFMAALVGYSPSLASGPPPRPAGSTMPGAARPCIGSVAEYCKKCPTYGERVEQLKLDCKGPNKLLRVSAERCVGAYRSVSRHDPLGGSDEYFDANGQLVAAYQTIDSFGFCNGSSTSRTFGRIPTCTTQFVTINLCSK